MNLPSLLIDSLFGRLDFLSSEGACSILPASEYSHNLSRTTQQNVSSLQGSNPLNPGRSSTDLIKIYNRHTTSMGLNYEALDVDSYEIRILNIYPGPPASLVRCSMTKTSLISPINYAALSYCWGDTVTTKNIFVDCMEIPVTTNLADALQHLRKIGVSKIWADALCINQTDKLEKGLQIRNMRHIFSKASMTYSWLGTEEDSTTAAVTFFMSLLDSPDSDLALAQTPHTCQRRRPNHQANREVSSQNGDCRCCQVESSFRALQRILQRQYWKRRWIIQETSVSYRPLLLCGNAAITLDELDQAVSRCRVSYYGHLVTETSFSWFDVTMKFRHSYQKGDKTSLCRAIALTREFESTDPRDAIFSLLALCYDGPELILTPNYFNLSKRSLRT